MNYNKTNHSISSPSHYRGRVAVLPLCLCAVLLFCFFTSCSQEETVQEGEGTAVGFTLPSITAGVEQDAATRASLATGVKVCVLVYKTGAQNSANYVGLKDYAVKSNGTLSANNGTELRLIDGTYDFYAFTPTSTVNPIGPTISVPQQKDFAVSLTTNVRVEKWTATETSTVKRIIPLKQLERKCAKVNFAIDVAEDVAPTITDTKIVKALLTHMPTNQVATGTSLPASSDTRLNLTLLPELFTTDPENPRKSSGSTILLPKTSSTFTLSMQAQFNKVTSITTQFPAVEVPAMSFDSGKEYTFTIRLTKDKLGNPTAGLWVTINKWVSSNQDYGLGGVPTGPITTQKIGEWKTLTWESGLGGIPTGPIITGVSNWWNNIYYNPHLGSSDKESND